MYDSTARRRARIFARILAGIALFLAAANPVLAQWTSSGLIARYALDGNVEDSTLNAYDGAASGAPRYATGLFGEALTSTAPTMPCVSGACRTVPSPATSPSPGS